MSSNKTFNLAKKEVEKIYNIKDEMSEAIDNFLKLSHNALEKGVLDQKTKELIALALAISKNSSECINYHLQCLINHGLSYEELLETASVIAYMHGGPGLMSAINTLKLYKSQIQQTETSSAASTTKTTEPLGSAKGYGDIPPSS